MMIDRSFLCLGGTPEKKLTLLGQRTPKYRRLQFFDEIYEEVQSFKINCEEESYVINHLTYTEK
jgi:hypothetical protein